MTPNFPLAAELVQQALVHPVIGALAQELDGSVLKQIRKVEILDIIKLLLLYVQWMRTFHSGLL